MKCYKCGGTITVKDSYQMQLERGKVTVYRKRKCKACGYTQVTQEVVTYAEIEQGYRHNNTIGGQ